MLTEIRDRSSGVFAWFIAALIVVPMTFFGVSQYASTEARPTIVEIGDPKIIQQDYQSRLTLAQNQARERNPNLANAGFLNSDAFKKQVFQGMVQRSLVDYVANEYEYRVSESQIDKIIRDTPNFQIDGKFDQNTYDAFSAGRGIGGSAQIKSDIRANVLTQQVVSGYQESALVLPNEVRALLEIQAEKRTFDLITVKKSDFNDSIVVTPEDIDQYYQTNINQFMLADRMSVNYIELDKAKLASEITIDDSIIAANYDDYVSSFVADETRIVRHILLKTGDGFDDDAQLKKAQSLITQLNDDADFVTLAKANSQDSGTANNGGSLGEVERGDMVAEFDEAAFALAEGQISDVIKTQFGYHIIKIDKINSTKPESFDDLRFQLEQEERDRLAEEQIVEQAEQLRNVLFEKADNLQAAADELSLKINTSNLFSREEGSGIATHDLVREAAFSDAVLNEGLNSELIEIADGVYVALHKLDFAAAEPKELANVSANIKETLTTQRASAAAKVAGDVLLERVENDWVTLAADDSIKREQYTVSMIDAQQVVTNDVMQEVVKMRLDNGSAVVKSFTDSNGDFNIIRLNTVSAGDLAAVSPQIKEATRNLIKQRNGQALFSSYLQSLNEELVTDVKVDLL